MTYKMKCILLKIITMEVLINIMSNITITKEQALAIAKKDAEKEYGDLSYYEVSCTLKDEAWHIDYALIDKSLLGGGPHYIISATDGTFIDIRYEQ